MVQVMFSAFVPAVFGRPRKTHHTRAWCLLLFLVLLLVGCGVVGVAFVGWLLLSVTGDGWFLLCFFFVRPRVVFWSFFYGWFH